MRIRCKLHKLLESPKPRHDSDSYVVWIYSLVYAFYLSVLLIWGVTPHRDTSLNDYFLLLSCCFVAKLPLGEIPHILFFSFITLGLSGCSDTSFLFSECRLLMCRHGSLSQCGVENGRTDWNTAACSADCCQFDERRLQVWGKFHGKVSTVINSSQTQNNNMTGRIYRGKYDKFTHQPNTVQNK